MRTITGFGGIIVATLAAALGCGGDDSAAPCGPMTCSGCCVDTYCLGGTASDACGTAGAACTSCLPGEVCPAGTCEPSTTCTASECAAGWAGCCAGAVRGTWSTTLGTCVCGGSDCPTDRDCTGRECGPDPVCLTSCGDCATGEVCSSGLCVFGGCYTADDCGAQEICVAGSCESAWGHLYRITAVGGTYYCAALDWDGSYADPYVVVTVDGVAHSSPFVDDTLVVNWNYHFDVALLSTSTFDYNVYNDNVTTDDLIVHFTDGAVPVDVIWLRDGTFTSSTSDDRCSTTFTFEAL